LRHALHTRAALTQRRTHARSAVATPRHFCLAPFICAVSYRRTYYLTLPCPPTTPPRTPTTCLPPPPITRRFPTTALTTATVTRLVCTALPCPAALVLRRKSYYSASVYYNIFYHLLLLSYCNLSVPCRLPGQLEFSGVSHYLLSFWRSYHWCIVCSTPHIVLSSLSTANS